MMQRFLQKLRGKGSSAGSDATTLDATTPDGPLGYHVYTSSELASTRQELRENSAEGARMAAARGYARNPRLKGAGPG